MFKIGRASVNPQNMFSEMLTQWSYVPTKWAEQLGYLRDRFQRYGSTGTLTSRENDQITRAYEVFDYYRGPRFVSGGAPGLGKRSSKQFEQRGLEHVETSDDDEKDHSSQGERFMNPIDMIDIMLKHPIHLTKSSLKWVQDIDKTVSEFDGPTQLTERQREVIEDIYAKYSKGGGPTR